MQGTRLAAVLLAAVALVGLTACEPGAFDAGESDAPSSEPTASPTDAPEDTEAPPSPAPTVDPVGGELDLACDQVVTPQQVYDLNANFAATSSPSAGVPAEVQAVADAGGVVCAWEHLTNGDPLLAAVAYASEAPDDADFEAEDGSVFIRGERNDDYWIVVASPYFSAAEPGAADLIAQIAGNLPEPPTTP